MNLTYRPWPCTGPGVEHAVAFPAGNLGIDECTIRHARDVTTSATWWNLWFRVRRDTDGEPELFCVPVNPGGAYTEQGHGGRTWGLTQGLPGVWQVSPSICVLADESRTAVSTVSPADRAAAAKGSLWHRTPTLVNVPAGEPWMP